MITKRDNTHYVTHNTTVIEFSDDEVTWHKAILISLEAKTLWPYMASDGTQYKHCREIVLD